MLKSIGEVKAFLSADYVILELNEEPEAPDEVLTVFARVTQPGLLEKTGLDHVDVPKGKVRVVGHQKGMIYLAERFRETRTQRRTVRRPIGTLLTQLQGDKEEIAEEVPGPWSATFEQASGLRVSGLRELKIGDLVAR